MLECGICSEQDIKTDKSQHSLWCWLNWEKIPNIQQLKLIGSAKRLGQEVIKTICFDLISVRNLTEAFTRHYTTQVPCIRTKLRPCPSLQSFNTEHKCVIFPVAQLLPLYLVIFLRSLAIPFALNEQCKPVIVIQIASVQVIILKIMVLKTIIPSFCALLDVM